MDRTLRTLGELASEGAAAVDLFLRHDLDFCCGGKRTLAEACAARGLDPVRLLAELDAGRPVAQPGPDWTERPLADLITHLVTRYHEPLRQDLPGLVLAARRVEEVHAGHPACPRGLAALLTEIQTAINLHLVKEEQVLFPALRGGARGTVVQMPVRVMFQEHDDHGANLARLTQLTGAFIPPPEACATWRGLYEGLARLRRELMEHIHLENNVLFPRALAG
ncbi:MAG: iron-sulfur cluster repair di-iron protein [Myxococcota bacterium]|jgi:regulator of cell morphogenesis and NO signaling|nr:iron-sulfur cluster repair di-iron protein [Myxococcota bacterium]